MENSEYQFYLFGSFLMCSDYRDIDILIVVNDIEDIKKAEIIVGEPKLKDLKQAMNLKWLQLPSAGCLPYTDTNIYANEKVLLLTEGDLFSYKKAKTSQKAVKQDLDLFAEQMATLREGDYVIHVDHGVGKYLGLESMEIGGPPADFLVIEYQDNDKIYVPIYKMNLIQNLIG